MVNAAAFRPGAGDGFRVSNHPLAPAMAFLLEPRFYDDSCNRRCFGVGPRRCSSRRPMRRAACDERSGDSLWALGMVFECRIIPWRRLWLSSWSPASPMTPTQGLLHRAEAVLFLAGWTGVLSRPRTRRRGLRTRSRRRRCWDRCCRPGSPRGRRIPGCRSARCSG